MLSYTDAICRQLARYVLQSFYILLLDILFCSGFVIHVFAFFLQVNKLWTENIHYGSLFTDELLCGFRSFSLKLFMYTINVIVHLNGLTFRKVYSFNSA